MTSQTYRVDGMTCSHCAASVSGGLGSLEGVSAVSVDLATGSVTVESAAPLALDAVDAAVVEAGYLLRRPNQLSLSEASR